DYIRDAQEALSRFDEAVDWIAIEPGREAEINGEDENDEAEDKEADPEIVGITPVLQQVLFAPEPDPPVIELYRRERVLELHPSDWRMALLIFKEMGWTPERPVEAYATPLAFVMNYEG